MGVTYNQYTLQYNAYYEGYEIIRYDGQVFSTTVLRFPSAVNGVPVKKIGAAVFKDFTSLTAVYLPELLVSIGVQAFYNCNQLTTVEIPESVTAIEDFAFYGCRIKSIIIPKNVTSIGSLAFGNNYLTSASLPLRFKDYTFENLGISESIVRLSASRSELDATLNDKYNTGQQSILSNPNIYSLYNTSQIQNMALGDLVLNRQENGGFVLNYDIEQSTDLQTWTPYEALSLPLTRLPTDKAFVRIKVIDSNQPIAPPEPPAVLPMPPSATPIGSNF
jgi:hypothetical protein